MTDVLVKKIKEMVRLKELDDRMKVLNDIIKNSGDQKAIANAKMGIELYEREKEQIRIRGLLL